MKWRVIACIVAILILSACLNWSPVEVSWSRIQDAPVPVWLESWALSKAGSVNSQGCKELSRVIVEQNGIETAQDAVQWLRKNFNYIQEVGDFWVDIKTFIERGGGDCEDWSIAVARLWQALGLESYVIIHFNADTIYAHAFAVFTADQLLFCATPYRFLEEPFTCLEETVEYMNSLYSYQPGPYIAIPIEKIGSGAGGSSIGAE